MITEHKLVIKDRNGMASLWIGRFNIWDVPHTELTPEVLSAIRQALTIGYGTAVSDMRDITSTVTLARDWDDQRKPK